MSRSGIGVGVALVLAISTLPVAGESLDGLAFLTGCWLSEGDGGFNEECWMSPHGGLMVGMSRSKSPTGTVQFEFLRIEAGADSIRYLASPGGGESTAFELEKVGESDAVFVNPGHDFPQRIHYWLENGKLHARVEAMKNGEMRGFELVWAASELAR